MTRYELGSSIRKIRASKGLNQEDLAKECGLKQQHIARIEAGKHSFGIDQYLAVLAALGCELVVESKSEAPC